MLEESTIIKISDSFLSAPPPLPKRLIIGIFFFFANFANLIKLIDCFFLKLPPDVEKINNTSFLFCYDENSLHK